MATWGNWLSPKADLVPWAETHGEMMNSNGNAGSQDGGNGGEYGSTEETALLSRAPPPPVVVAASVSSSQGKPVLTRQDRATFLVASPQLSVSGLGGSEESATNEETSARSVPDIELHCRLDATCDSQQIFTQQHSHGPTVTGTVSSVYGPSRTRQLSTAGPHHYNRCRCDRRESLAPSSALHLARSISR